MFYWICAIIITSVCWLQSDVWTGKLFQWWQITRLMTIRVRLPSPGGGHDTVWVQVVTGPWTNNDYETMTPEKLPGPVLQSADCPCLPPSVRTRSGPCLVSCVLCDVWCVMDPQLAWQRHLSRPRGASYQQILCTLARDFVNYMILSWEINHKLPFLNLKLLYCLCLIY